MTEVEKMMQNANLTNLYCGDDYVAERMLEFECTDGDKEKCKTCDKAKTNYPPFTAEKQLFLIQLLAETRPIHINLLLDKWTIEGMGRHGILYDTFEDALSGYINQIWQDLTKAERTQIKEILE